jgi:hypothetical protein
MSGLDAFQGFYLDRAGNAVVRVYPCKAKAPPHLRRRSLLVGNPSQGSLSVSFTDIQMVCGLTIDIA